MYNDLYAEMMRLMATTLEKGGVPRKTISKVNVERFISICLAHGVNTYTIEEMIISHGKLTSAQAIDHLEAYIEGTAIRHCQPIEYNGKRYDSQVQLAKEVGMSISTIRYQIKNGFIKKLEE